MVSFMLTRGLDPDYEILETERLLIANGGTPSVFFRFPGLVSSSALMQAVRRHHLISIGADAWLAKGQKPGPGSIILVHPNGNEVVVTRVEKARVNLYRIPAGGGPVSHRDRGGLHQPAGHRACHDGQRLHVGVA